MRRLLLVGGGHAHLGVLKMLATQPIAGCSVTLVSASSRQIYSGMLPGWIAGRYSIDECSISLTDLAARARATFHAATITRLSLEDGEVTSADGRSFGFDLLSIDCGSEPAIGGIAGAAAHALSIRPIEAFVTSWPAVVERWKRRDSIVELAVVGSGAAAVELAFAVHHRAAVEGLSHVHVTLIGRESRPLEGLARAAVERVVRSLRRRGVAWRGSSEVTSIASGRLSMAHGVSLPFDTCLLATGAAAPRWPGAAGLETDDQGFIRVDRTLRSVSDSRVFAAGDVAALKDARPKSGVFAVRAAPVLGHNLAAACGQGSASEWAPQRYALYLLSTGDGRAIAAWRSWSAAGRWVWQWKDWIDRGFVRRFRAPSR